MNILVVDDDKNVRTIICRILKDAGYNISIAVNGNEALNLLNIISDIEIVITDIMMPEKDGLETIREIKQDYPKIKILAISGGGKIYAQNYLNIALKMGADSILNKPFLKQELLDAIQKL